MIQEIQRQSYDEPAQTSASTPTTAVETSPDVTCSEEQSVEALLKTMQREHRQRVRLISICKTVALIVSFLLLSLAFAARTDHFPKHLWRLSLLLVVSMDGIAWLFAKRIKHRSNAQKMARLNDVRAVGSLIDVVNRLHSQFDYDEITRDLATDALIRLLPLLKTSDAALLNRARRQALNKALLGDDVRLTLAILQAYAQLGDSKAIPAVRKLAEGRNEAAEGTKVREVARACLQLLEQRALQGKVEPDPPSCCRAGYGCLSGRPPPLCSRSGGQRCSRTAPSRPALDRVRFCTRFFSSSETFFPIYPTVFHEYDESDIGMAQVYVRFLYVDCAASPALLSSAGAQP